jgi:hypothetical protein
MRLAGAVALVVMMALAVLLVVVRSDRNPSPAAEASYIEAACYDLNHDLPPPSPLQFHDGNSLQFSCSVPGA